MNVHPILVHFPIALLSIYAILECIRFKQITKQEYWFYVKTLLLLLGTASLFPTGLAGKLIEGQFTTLHPIIEIHSTFALASTCIFAILSLLSISHWLTLIKIFRKNSFVYNSVVSIDTHLFKTYIIIPLAILGLISISITGVLGAIIVYGPNLDIFTQFVYHIFFPSN